MSIKLANNASGTLATAINTSDTGIVLTTNDGAEFPTLGIGEYFYGTLESTGGTLEIVKVTARSGDSLTVERAQEGTSPAGFAAGALFEARVTAQSVIDTIYGITNYQGASAANPTVRVDGTPLEAGDFYFNTTASEVRFYNGVTWQSLTTGTIEVQNFVGNGSTAIFTLSNSPTGEVNTQVYLNGVYQQKDTYSVSGLSLIFSTAPPSGTTIEVVTIEAIAVGRTSADLVTYAPAGAGAVTTNVQTKLRETVSVKDFGADSTGAVSSNVEIQAAIDYVASLGGGVVEFENGGTYLVSGQILLKTNVSLRGNGCTVSVNPLNYTGGITQFFGVFSTVNIIARPLPILFRIGTGVISFENIQIDGFIFNINRNGNVLTSGQMDVADINIVRFEDARNCKVTNCQFIDGETVSNNNGDQVVYFVRSELCEISNCYAKDTTLIYLAESEQCTVADNYLPQSVGTTIETVAGASHRIINNRLGATWWSVSSIGVNSAQCVINDNTIEKSALSGITIGHPTPTGNANFYNLPLAGDFSACRNNYILSGDDLTSGHGYTGILIQAAAYTTVADNTILNLRKKASLADRNGGILVQPDSAAEATGLQIERNRINTAHTGVYIARSKSATISENSISDVLCAVVQNSPTEFPQLIIQANTIEDTIQPISLLNGYAVINGNYITTSTSTFSFARGHFRFENNFMSEVGAMNFFSAKSVSLVGNVFENAVPIANAANIDGQSTVGSATIDQITVFGNSYPGTTNVVRIVNVIGQATRVFNVTVPTQFRTTSYNVGSLPTANTGLGTGDLWNDAGTVKVV
jgi:hypothetical protein